MSARADYEKQIATLVRQSWESRSVPTANVGAIETRRHARRASPIPSPQARNSAQMRFAVALLLMLVLLVSFANPKVARFVSAAVMALHYKVYSPKVMPDGTVTEIPDPVTTLDAARRTFGGRFIEPAGLPQGSRIISVTGAVASTQKVFVLYRNTQGGLFSVSERVIAGTPLRPIQKCFAIQGAPQAMHQLFIAQQRGSKAMPAGIHLLPCSAGEIGGTNVQITGQNGQFTSRQGQAILQAMRKLRIKSITR